MIVDDLNVRGAWRSILPRKTNPPLIVNPDAVLSFAVSLQSFKAITWQNGKVRQRHGCFESVELEPGGAFDAGKRFNMPTGREIPRSLIPVTEDHIEE